jgi:hypothetical protein
MAARPGLIEIDLADGTRRKAVPTLQSRPPAYHLGTLEDCRQAFELLTGLKTDWQDGEPDAPAKSCLEFESDRKM